MDTAQEIHLAPPENCEKLRNGCGFHNPTKPSTSPTNARSSPYHRHQYRNHQNNDSLYADVMDMFSKCFVYQKNKTAENTWILPSNDILFSEYYQLDSLQQLKLKLNEVKSKLNDYVIEDWSLHTRRKDPAGEIPWRLKSETQAEFVTIAWCKLYECLSRFPSLAKGPRMNSLHLCEAPGAFIASLNHYLHSNYDKDELQWNWLATTLNPYYEGNPVTKMIMDDRFMLYTLDNWLFHKDFTGNIIDNDNLEHMKQQCIERLGEVHLITADGSVDCIASPDVQEEKVDQLHFAEILTALEILAPGGSFVIKMFTLFEATSLSKMYLLNCAFKEVHVFKPCTSKRGNSEVYIICLNYQKDCNNLKEILQKMKEKLKGDSVAMCPLFPKSCMPNDFLMQHEIMCRLFMNYQSNAIESNVYSFEIKPSKFVIKRLQGLRTLVCDEYYKRYKIKKLPEELKILYKYKAYIEKGYKTQIYQGSHSERELLKDTSKEEQLFKLRKRLNDLGRTLTETSHDDQFKRNDNTTIKLKLYKGKSLEELHSTLFANVHLLVMRSQINDFYMIDVLWPQDARIEFPNNDFVLNFSDFISDSSLKFSTQQQLFFKSFIENLLKYKPILIKFINMPFLSHFASSILRYLSLAVYDNLTFSFHPSFEITLENISVENFNSTLTELNSALLGTDADQAILCFINILELHHNNFNKVLTSFNNMLLLQNFKSILDN